MTNTAKPTLAQDTAIGQLLRKFTQGDSTMFDHVAPDIDFRIDHFHDEADTSWQTAQSLNALISVVGRLGQEVFPKGTIALGIDTQDLGDGWCLTRFNQRFFYGIRQADVTSLTYIMSHETEGKVDFFRETVTNIVDA